MARFFLNTGFDGYKEICNDKNYVDKTGLIGFVDSKINKPDKLILVSRPRRFGKTYAAQMLKAYYTIGYDTRGLFKDKEICRIDPRLTYQGKFDVIYIDIVKVRHYAKDKQNAMDKLAKEKDREPERLDWIGYRTDSIIREIAQVYGAELAVEGSLVQTLIKTVAKNNGIKFIWICDEWDNFFS